MGTDDLRRCESPAGRAGAVRSGLGRRIRYEIPPVPGDFVFGEAIVSHHARYLRTSTPHGKEYRMFHGVVVRSRDGQTYSVGCDGMDRSGYCLGHAMSRGEFIERYCGGKEPPHWRPDRGALLRTARLFSQGRRCA